MDWNEGTGEHYICVIEEWNVEAGLVTVSRYQLRVTGVTLQERSWGSAVLAAAGQVIAAHSPVLSLLSLQSPQDMLQGKAAIILHPKSNIHSVGSTRSSPLIFLEKYLEVEHK